MKLTKEQELVIKTRNKSLLVSASAGSGKTFVVIERILDSIINKKINVDKLLVLTFTNAAASELKERLIKKLYEKLDEFEAKKDYENINYISKQIGQVSSSDISTIHSFCLSIIKNNFFIIGMDPNVSTLDDSKASIMVQESLNKIIEKEYEKSDDILLKLLDVLGNEEILMENLLSIYKFYSNVVDKEKWLMECENIYNIDEKKLIDITETNLGKNLFMVIKERLIPLKLELEKLISKTDELDEFLTRREILQTILKSINIAIDMKQYDELYKYLPSMLEVGNLPRSKVSDEELRDEIKNLKNKVMDEVKSIREIAYKDTKGLIYDLNSCSKYIKWITTVISSLDETYSKEKQKQGVIDFSDYEHLALKILQNEEIRKIYMDKYEEIYIDEYQDTSLLQEEILSKISKEDNLIMVGDVKQSIYGFRNAKPELFSKKYDEYNEVEADVEESNVKGKIVLAQNFRSRKAIIDSINLVFGKLMSIDFGGAKYSEKEALVYGQLYPEDEERIHKAELNIVEYDKNNIEISRTENVDEEDNNTNEYIEELSNINMESIMVAKRVNELIDKRFQVYDLKQGSYRDCKFKDIVILMRTVEKNAQVVCDVLRQNRIPVYSDGKIGFYNTDEISLVMSFIKVIDNYYDDISLVSVMYSIIGEFTLDELVKIRNCKNKGYMMDSIKYFLTVTEDKLLKEKLESFLNLIDRFKKYLLTYKISELLLKLYNETGIYDIMMLEKNGKMKCANLDAFIQIVYDYEKTSGVSLYDFIKYIENIKTKSSSGDSPKILGENEDVVRIMTIHKSKGLEFPVVILMNTASSYNLRDTSERILTDDEYGIALNIYDETLNITYPSAIKQIIKAKIKSSLVSEALRLLYVAMTRAKEKLIIYGTVKNYEKHISDVIVSDEEQSGKIPAIISKTYNSHLKCITQAMLQKSNSLDVFDVVIHNISDKSIKECDELTNLSETKVLREEHMIDKFKEIVTNRNIEVDDQYVKRLKERFERKYNFEDSKNIEQKLTATGIKQSLLGKDFIKSSLINLKPEVLDTKMSEVSYGTFIHTVLEHIDFTNVSNDSIKEQIAIDTKALSVEDKIDIDKVQNSIINFFESDFKNILDNADVIQKELEFVIEDKLENIEGLNLVEPTLIQGVVDLYIETKDKRNIIIDFKTDRVENERELIDNYKYQLYVYKRGMEISKDIKITDMYIYSFELNKLIKIE